MKELNYRKKNVQQKNLRASQALLAHQPMTLWICLNTQKTENKKTLQNQLNNNLAEDNSNINLIMEL